MFSNTATTKHLVSQTRLISIAQQLKPSSVCCPEIKNSQFTARLTFAGDELADSLEW